MFSKSSSHRAIKIISGRHKFSHVASQFKIFPSLPITLIHFCLLVQPHLLLVSHLLYPQGKNPCAPVIWSPWWCHALLPHAVTSVWCSHPLLPAPMSVALWSSELSSTTITRMTFIIMFLASSAWSYTQYKSLDNWKMEWKRSSEKRWKMFSFRISSLYPWANALPLSP